MKRLANVLGWSAVLAVFVGWIAVVAVADEPVGGPVTDILVERRLDAIIDRIEAKQAEAFEAMARRNEGPFAELRSEVRQAVSQFAKDREEIAEMRKESKAIFPKLAEFIDTSQGFVAGAKDIIAGWTPIRDGIDAINQLIWKVFTMGVLILIGVGILKYVAVKLLGLVFPKWLMPIALVAVSPSFAFAQVRCEQMQGPNPVYRVCVPQYQSGYGSTGHSYRPQAIYYPQMVSHPIRSVVVPVVHPIIRIVEPVVAPVASAVRNVSGCANGQCGTSNRQYVPRLPIR